MEILSDKLPSQFTIQGNLKSKCLKQFSNFLLHLPSSSYSYLSGPTANPFNDHRPPITRLPSTPNQGYPTLAPYQNDRPFGLYKPQGFEISGPPARHRPNSVGGFEPSLGGYGEPFNNGNQGSFAGGERPLRNPPPGTFRLNFGPKRPQGGPSFGGPSQGRPESFNGPNFDGPPSRPSPNFGGPPPGLGPNFNGPNFNEPPQNGPGPGFNGPNFDGPPPEEPGPTFDESPLRGQGSGPNFDDFGGPPPRNHGPGPNFDGPPDGPQSFGGLDGPGSLQPPDNGLDSFKDLTAYVPGPDYEEFKQSLGPQG